MKKTDFEMFGACVGKGWQPLVQPLLKELAELGGTPLQIKEKFGGLRFYYSPGSDGWSDEFDKKVQAAETASFSICEDCGKPGKRRGNGWIRTLCDTHAEGREPITDRDLP